MCTGNGGYFDNGNYGNGDVNNHIQDDITQMLIT